MVDGIAITNLKEFLSYGPDCPKWAVVSDIILRTKMRVEDRNRLPTDMDAILMDPFIQSWRAVKGRSMPNTLREMIRVSDKYKLCVDVPRPWRDLRRQMPLWEHPHTQTARRNTIKTIKHRCLAHTHHIRSVGDAEDLSLHLQNSSHAARRNCRCDDCVQDREAQCPDPHGCAVLTSTMLGALDPKWDPRPEFG
ncbi:hypothetical protein FB107DRAFT_216147 [Schizophyllum commune]